MKKKLILMMAMFIMSMTIFTGCSCNMKVFDTNYKYNKALVYEGGVWNEYVVDSWSDYGDGTITIWTTDGKMIYTSSVNVVMYG